MALVVYIDDSCVVSFGTREEHEILLLRVLKRMDVHNLKKYTFSKMYTYGNVLTNVLTVHLEIR
jgi:hypothetical protein